MSVLLVAPCAMFLLWMGCMALYRPRSFVRMLEMDATTPLARSEVRAVYGGYGVAMGAALLAGLFLPTGLPAGLPAMATAVSIAMAGMAGGRMVSCALDKAMPRVAKVFTAIELGIATALWSAATSPAS